MVCKNFINNQEYNYEFVEDGMVKLTNPNMKTNEDIIYIKYEDWCMDYLIIDKWRNL